MTVLRRCTSVHGNATIIEAEPQFSLHSNLTYFPGVWGLYDQGQKLVTGTAFFRRSNGLDLVGADYTRDFQSSEIVAEAPDQCYYFMGHIPGHYGHFLLSALCRLWAYAAKAGRGMKVITYGPVDETILARSPYVLELLGALGIGFEDLVTFDHPTRLRRVMVASASFEETNLVHAAYIDLCRNVGNTLAGRLAAKPSATPIYLAKYNLPFGVMKLANEEEFASRLARHGVEIVFPEQLNVSQQIRLWSDRTHVAGLIGSAFHTASFVSPRKLMTLNYDAGVLSNQVMIDRAGRHDPLYLFSERGVEHVEAAGQFSAMRALRDPLSVAEDFLRILDPFMDIKPTDLRSVSAGPSTPDRLALPNLALRQPARQSSASQYSMRRAPGDDAAGAVSGFLTGGFQFSTDAEDDPWWDVDLGTVMPVHEIHIFNRLDSARERAARFRIVVSLDDIAWTEIYHRDEWPPFGGIDGRPFVWRATTAVPARYVRIVQSGYNFLHLDQVAIFGPDPAQPAPPIGLGQAAIYLKTQWGKLICLDAEGRLVGRAPAEIGHADTLVRFDVPADPPGRVYQQSLDGRQVVRSEAVCDGRLAGLVLHLLADPWTAALSQDGLYFSCTPDDPYLKADRTAIRGWEMFARLDEADLAQP